MESGMTYPPALIATGPLKGVTSRGGNHPDGVGPYVGVRPGCFSPPGLLLSS